MKKIVIHITAQDQRGIVSKYTELISSSDINILNLEQHVESNDSLFFMRIYADMKSSNISISEFRKKLEQIDRSLNATSLIHSIDRKLNIAVLVTKESLPLYDLLIKNEMRELNSQIKVIISNHDKLSKVAAQFDVEYRAINMNEDKLLGNNNLKSILDSKSIDLVVLARYMQIIPKDIVDLYRGKMINIHHGFLPAFKGANPYRQAWERGVKIIGATAHYVTEELDEGPIIAQDVSPVTHHHSIEDMIESGRNLERNVLIDAVKAHLEYRVIIHGKRAIVFNK